MTRLAVRPVSATATHGLDMDRRSRPVSHLSSSRSRSSSRTSYSDIVAAQTSVRDRAYSTAWQDITVFEVIKDHQPIFCDTDTSIEEAAAILSEHDLTQIPIRSSKHDQSLVRTFDYSDLCALLLMILDVDESPADFRETVRAARAGNAVPVALISDLGFKVRRRCRTRFCRLALTIPLDTGRIHDSSADGDSWCSGSDARHGPGTRWCGRWSRQRGRRRVGSSPPHVSLRQPLLL